MTVRSGWSRRILACLLPALAVLCPESARAQTPCSGSISALDFGTVSGLTGTVVDATAVVSLTCTSNVDILACVHLGRGGGTGLVAGPREVTNGGSVAAFELYADAGRTQLWRTIGTTTNAQNTTPIIVPKGTSVTRTQTIYGRLTLGTGAAGNYASAFLPGVDVLVQGNANNAIGVGRRDCNRDHSYSAPLSFDVRASVAAFCNITGGTLDFGTSGPIVSNIDAAGSLTVGCTNGTSYAVTLDNGQNALSGQRRMASGTNRVTYELYTDAARSQAWSGTTAATGTGSGADVTIPIYGRVPPQGAPSPGTYSDTVVVTVTY